MNSHQLTFRPDFLTKAAFAPYGDVIEIDGAETIAINQGYATRFNNLANIVLGDGGQANLSIFLAQPRSAPIRIELMERHPLASQCFYPLQNRPWLVVVSADPHDAASYKAFLATGTQGVNYARNVWHHPLLVFDRDSRFLVVDRMGPEANLEECQLSDNELLFVEHRKT